MKLTILIVLVFNLAVAGATIYIAGSVVTSGVKAVADKCDTRYPVEKVFNGNWFCPEK